MIRETASGAFVVDAGQITSVVVDPQAMIVTGGSGDPNDPGYPDVIIDQRRGYGHPDLASPNDLEAFWQSTLSRREPPVEIVDDPTEVVAYINASRWVADCVCDGGAMFCWDRNPRACCLLCGRRFFVRWEPPAVRAAVIRELAGRPEPNRNWDPRLRDELGGLVETPEFLHRENVLMGVDCGVYHP